MVKVDEDDIIRLKKTKTGKIKWPKNGFQNYYCNFESKKDAIMVIRHAIKEWPIFLEKVRNKTLKSLKHLSASVVGMDICDEYKMIYGCMIDTEEQTISTQCDYLEVSLRLPKSMKQGFEHPLLKNHTFNEMCMTKKGFKEYLKSIKDERV